MTLLGGPAGSSDRNDRCCELAYNHLFRGLGDLQPPTYKGVIIHNLLSILVGGFNPSEKYARQIGSFPHVGMKIKNV